MSWTGKESVPTGAQWHCMIWTRGLKTLACIGGEGWQGEIDRLRRAGAVHHEARAEHDPAYASLHRAVLEWERHPGQTEEEFRANEWERIAFEERQTLQTHMKREKKTDGVEVKKPGFFAS